MLTFGDTMCFKIHRTITVGENITPLKYEDNLRIKYRAASPDTGPF